MKKFILTLILVFLSYGIALSSCYEGCDDPEYITDTVTVYIPESDCYIFVTYQYRILECPEGTINDLKIISLFGALDSSCADITYPIVFFETAVSLLLGDPQKNPFPDFPGPGACNTTYRVAGPSCWELVYLSIGPFGEGYYLIPCAETPLCCRPYKVCRTLMNVIQVIPLSYTPVSCASVIGPETNLPCVSTCPN